MLLFLLSNYFATVARTSSASLGTDARRKEKNADESNYTARVLKCGKIVLEKLDNKVAD
jgi:hypothetical protein